MKSPKLVIVDNDCGIDDAWALNFLLNATSDVKVLAITCVNGNSTVDNVCHNNLYFLKIAGREEIPVYRGADKPLLTRDLSCIPGPDHVYFHGKNGFGDVCLPENDLVQVQEENGIVALHRISSQHKGEVSLICCGPLTNIALALRTYRDFKDNIKDVFIMGGNYTAMGNVTMSAEFNFHVDPEAVHIVFNEMKSKITLLPWETCLKTDIPFEWREELGKSDGKIMNLLNTVEYPIISRTKKLGYKRWILCDQLLAAIYINRDVAKEVTDDFAAIELSGNFTRGQLVIDHLNVKEPNIKLIKEVNNELLKEMLLQLKSF